MWYFGSFLEIRQQRCKGFTKLGTVVFTENVNRLPNLCDQGFKFFSLDETEIYVVLIGALLSHAFKLIDLWQEISHEEDEITSFKIFMNHKDKE